MGRKSLVGVWFLSSFLVHSSASAIECSSEYFLYGSQTLTIGDRATVSHGSIGAGTLAQLGVGTHVQGTLVADSITLANNAILNGSVFTNHPVSSQAGAKIFGQVLPVTPGLLCTSPAVPTLTPGGQDIFVEGTVELPPGQYGHIDVAPHSTLIVSSGAYAFKVVIFEPDSRLVGVWKGAPASLFVTEGIMFGDRHRQTAARSSDNANSRAAISIYSLQQQQLRLGTDSTIISQIIAPFAEVNVPPRAVVNAPLYGRIVHIEPDATIGAFTQPNACQ